MIQTQQFKKAVIDSLEGRANVRITHMFLLKDWFNESSSVTFSEVLAALIPNGIAARGASMAALGNLVATFRLPIEGEITGVALIADGNLSIDQQNSYDNPTGDEKVAFIEIIEPLEKLEWDDLTIEVIMS